ncbi:MAG: hypothetical protein ACRD0G_12125 [Acidimicrobiales bacterium]
MFTVFCPHHQADVLLSERRIQALENGDDGIRVHWECSCGTRGSYLTGRKARVAGPVVRTRLAS